MSKWTPQQENAIYSRGKSLIVSAAAGSGKTSVLVERLLSILSNEQQKVPADKIIVVTFTKNSASEMKQRLTYRLSQLIEENPESSWLYRQQMLLQSAKISTIHSFCFDLIRDNIRKLDISAGFRIIEESEEKIIIRKSAETVIESAYKEYPSQMDRLFNTFCHKDDLDIIKILEQLHNFCSSIPFPENWLENVLSHYLNTDADAFIKEYKALLVTEMENAYCALCDFENMMNNLESQKDIQKFIEALADEISCIHLAQKLFSDDTAPLTEIVTRLDNICWNKFPSHLETPKEVSSQLLNLRNEYKDIIKKITACSHEAISFCKEDLRSHAEIIDFLITLYKKLQTEISDAKSEKNALGFSDAESLAIKLLSDIDQNGNITKSKLALELSEYYELIMVDEFQDSNNNQDLIFKLLSKDGTAEKYGNNLFAVGDVKQCIYRFRRANPQNFIDAVNKSVPYSEDTNDNSLIVLNTNFRSCRQTIDFINFLFEIIMSEKCGEITYSDNEKLVNGTEYKNFSDHNTEIAFVSSDFQDTASYMQAEYVANKISSMIAEKYPVTEKDDTLRPCTNRDFCILFRSKKNADVYVKALEKYNIPAYSDETSGYLKSREISLLINLLKVIDNPLNDSALTAVMLSPMFSMTADDVSLIRLTDRKSSMYNSLCKAIGKSYSKKSKDSSENSEQPSGKSEILVNDELYNKALLLYDTINNLRMYSTSFNLQQLIRKIYDSTDFLSIVQTYSDSRRKQANLRILLEYARIYEENGSSGLSGFLRYIKNLSDTGGDFKQGNPVSVSEDVVSLKTIHSSKGLEYPFVFLVETEKKFVFLDSKKKIRISFEKGIGFAMQDTERLIKYKSLPFQIIDDFENKKIKSEEMRLLYVALTRAKEKLFITIPSSVNIEKSVLSVRNGTPSEKIISEANSFAEWITYALLHHSQNDKLFKIFGIKGDTLPASSSIPLNLTEFKISNPDSSSDNKTSLNFPADPLAFKKLENIFAEYEKNDFSVSEYAAKLSVSEASSFDRDFLPATARPRFKSEGGSLTGAERGTALHTFMQFADFSKLSSDIPAEIKRCADNGFITPVQAENININKVQNFTESILFKMILSADKVWRERDFIVKISDLNLPEDDVLYNYKDTDGMLQGIADLMFEKDGRLYLVDYKTDYVKTSEELTAEYSRQLMLYKYSLELIENRKIENTYIYSFSLSRTIKL